MVMSKSIQTQIEINASANRIWEVLTDFENYSNWNPFIQKISGTLEVGEQLHISIGKMQFDPKVLEVSSSRGFRWKGKLWFKGLFDGEHWFEIEPVDENRCVLHHGEHFSGILVPLMKKDDRWRNQRRFQSNESSTKDSG